MNSARRLDPTTANIVAPASSPHSTCLSQFWKISVTVSECLLSPSSQAGHRAL